LYNMIIGDVQSLSYEIIRENIERVFPYNTWKTKVIAVLQCLPSTRCSLQEWYETILVNIGLLVEKNVIALRNTKILSDIIKIKSRDKENPDFLKQPLYSFIEKKSTQGVTVSSIHGVKGETFDAILLMVDSTTGSNTLTPSVLNKKPLTDELVRIAYVSMTRPRKLLVVSIPKTGVALSRFPAALWEYVEI
jgi:DNA helicase II / ATP-dependent DNA helicase PcrA